MITSLFGTSGENLIEFFGVRQVFAELVDAVPGPGLTPLQVVGGCSLLSDSRGGLVEGVDGFEQLFHLVKGEVEGFHSTDDQEALDVGFGVEAEASCTARRRGYQADLVIVADCANRQFGAGSDLPDLHVRVVYFRHRSVHLCPSATARLCAANCSQARGAVAGLLVTGTESSGEPVVADG